MKIVINSCFGGFSLSDEATARYLTLAGRRFWKEKGGWGNDFWLVPKEERLPELSAKEWQALSQEERVRRNAIEERFYNRDIRRDDSLLVQVVEEMGAAANGDCAALRIVEVPDGVEWEIVEYDGSEHVAETHRTWA